jgi:transcriptional antiterminator RfaH
MIHWYAFQSKARKEQLVSEQLRIRRIEVFFPRVRVQSVNSRARGMQPYFPGYLFGRVDLEKYGRSIVDWIPGALRIVNFGGEPVPVPDYFIDILRHQLEVINAHGAEFAPEFQPGDAVTIQQGPLAGYEGIFNARLPGRDRAEVLLNMLQGSHVRVQLSIDQITSQKS